MEEQKFSLLVENILSIKPIFFLKSLGKSFLALNITPGAYFAMVHLKKRESLSMSDLGKTLCIPKPNVTALVNKLIAKGLVIRFSDKEDRRIIMIRLSSKGIQYIEKNNKLYREQIQKRLMLLSEKELEIFSDSLQQVKDIFSKIMINE
jgi:DNA-binding MarR family transcriptional regulator